MSDSTRFDAIPDEMKNADRWVLWKTETRKGTPTKVPYSSGHNRASSTDALTWSTFKAACLTYEMFPDRYDGIGFMLGGGFCGIDLDHHITDGVCTEFAVETIERFNSYTEYSPSGEGIHIIVIGKKPGERAKAFQEMNTDGTGQTVEIYDHARYFTVTGNAFHAGNVCDRQGEIEKFYHEIFPAREQTTRNTTSQPLNLADSDIVDMAKRSRIGAKFSALWHGTHSGDHSGADLALCNYIAFYTQDAAQVDRIFRAGGLYREDKWNRYIPGWDCTYGDGTVKKAIDDLTEAWTPKAERAGQSGDGGDEDSDDKDDKSTDEWVSSIVDETDEAKRKKMIDDFLMTLVDRSPLDIEIALKALNKADKRLGMSMLRKQLDFLRRQFMPGVGGEKTAKELAQEFLDTRYRHESGELTVVFQNDSWYEWTGAKYDELIRSEYDTKIIKMIAGQVAMDVSQNLVTSIRLATQPEALVSRHLQAPFWRSTEMYTEDLISLENGILDLKALFDGQPNPLIPHTPDLFILSNQPYPYDETAQCPRWLRFLDESMIEYELKLVIQEFFGLSLTHDQRFHKFLFLQGESRTGKGVTFSVLQALVGQDNVSNVPLREFGNQFGLYPMFGKKLNINAEIPELDKVAEDVLKEYTGGSTVINYNRKNIATPIISPQRARLAFSSNHFPTFTDRTGGLWNRMLLIPFQNVVSAEREDVGLIDHLITKELSGIFNWAVEGYRRLCKQGRFTVSKAIDDSVNDYKTESIPVNAFMDTYVTFDKKHRVAVHSKTLYRYYCLWAKCEGKYQQNAVTFGRDVAAYVLAKSNQRGEKDRYGLSFHGFNFDHGKIGRPDAKTIIVERAIKMGFLRDDTEWDYSHDDAYDTQLGDDTDLL